MSRTGWNLLSPRYMLTKVPAVVLSDYYCHGYPFTPKMADRPYNQYGPHLYSEARWDQLCKWLTGNPEFRRQLAGHKQALRATVRKPPTQVLKLAVLFPLQEREAPRLQQGLPGTVGLPHRLRLLGGLMGGGSRAVASRSPPTQQPSPCRSTFSMRWVALATLLLVA